LPVSPTSQQEFSDADWRVVATGDQSMKLALLLSGLTTATTRTWTVPDASGTVLLDGQIGVTLQAYDALLAAIAALTTSSGGFIRTTGSDTVAAQAINGTVSESSGVATGALFERGSNANGVYYRYANGLQVCTQSHTISTTTAANPPINVGLGSSWTFPAAFSALPAVYGNGDGGAVSVVGTATSVSTTSCTPQIIADRARANQSMQFTAVGRWF
jgi:hypothetical protein